MRRIENTVIYIPGVGQRYDRFRRLALWTWYFRLGVKAYLVPMHWESTTETSLQKKLRVLKTLEKMQASPCIVVAESAGGSIGIQLLARSPGNVSRLITICGKNRDAASITSAYHSRYPALMDSVKSAESDFTQLSNTRKKSITCFYSPHDKLLGSHDTTLPGCASVALRSHGHGRSIWSLLLLLNNKSFREAIMQKG